MIFEESEDVVMGKVKPILGQECAYFVLNEVTSQTHHIAQVSLQNFYMDENQLMSATLLQHSSANKVKRVFKMPESHIIAMQPCNDCLQRADADYRSNSMISNPGLNEVQAELFVLDSNLMLQRLREQNGTFDPVWSRNLGQNQNLAQLTASLRPFETVLLSDRTVSCRDKVVCIRNATEFNSFSEELRQQDDKIRKAESIETIPEPFGNQVSYHL